MKITLSELKQIVNEEVNKKLQESGFTKTMNVLHGIRPENVKSIGILTAMNPNMSKPHSDSSIPGYTQMDRELNNQFNKELKHEIKVRGIGYRKIEGKYGFEEKGFLLINPTNEQMRELSEKFNQQSYVFGKTREDGKVEFNIFRTIDGQKDNINKVTAPVSRFVEHPDDYFSRIKGKVFKFDFKFPEETSTSS